MRTLIPITFALLSASIACLMLVGCSERRDINRIAEQTKRITVLVDSLQTLVYAKCKPCPPCPDTVYVEKMGLAEFTYSANSHEFWGRNKVWLPIKRLNTEAMIKESECEIMEWRSDTLCTTYVSCWCIWLDEILYYVLENPFDKLSPDTLYRMPKGRWVTIDELRREEYPWPDSVFILNEKE